MRPVKGLLLKVDPFSHWQALPGSATKTIISQRAGFRQIAFPCRIACFSIPEGVN
jgi:hypothetical protein